MDFRQKNRQEWQISVRLAQRNILKKNNVRKEKLSIVFFRLSAKNTGTLLKNFWLRSLNWKLHFQGIKFYHIFWCSVTHFFNFRLSAEIFWTSSCNCFLRALRIVLTKERSFEQRSVLLKNFGFRAKKVLDFRQKNGKNAKLLFY